MRGATLVIVTCLLSACASVGAPRAGEPVVLKDGQALVFGRIHMLDAKDERIEYTPFKFDPWGGPFFSPLPRLSLELRQPQPPGGAVRYRSHPDPQIGEDGAFAWILESGDYQLMGNPRLYGSRRFDPNESGTLAHFAVPAPGGTVYSGTLIVRVSFGPVEAVTGWKRDELEYTIVDCRVVDESGAALAELRRKFASVPEPVQTLPFAPGCAGALSAPAAGSGSSGAPGSPRPR